MPSAARIGAALLCASGAAAQTTSVCMDGGQAAMLSTYAVDSLEYEMLMLRYKMGIAEPLHIPCTPAACDGVVVNVNCAPPPPPPPPLVRPGVPPPPPPAPAPPGTQSVQGSLNLDVSPEYAAAICRAGSDEQRTMIMSVQEQTAARLSVGAGCNNRKRTFTRNQWVVSCAGCSQDTCFQPDSITIDPTTFGCAPVNNQQVENQMTLSVSDEFAASLCAGPGSTNYDDTSLVVRRSVAGQLGISESLVSLDQITSGLDCSASRTDQAITGNEVGLDISPEYAHMLCDPNSAAFAQFKRTFQAQIAASINGNCDPAALRPGDPPCAHVTPEQIQVQDEDIFNNAHCADMAAGNIDTNMGNGATSNGPLGADVDAAAAGEGSSAFDLAILVLVVACVGVGYRQKNKKAEAKYQAVNVDEEIPLSDYSIDGPSDGVDRDRRENPSFGSQAFGSGRIGSGKRR